MKRKIIPLTLLFVLATSYFSFAQEIGIGKINSLIIDGEYSSAINDLQKLISTDSSNVNLYIKLAYCYSSLRNYDKAITVLENAATINNENPKLLSALGNNYLAAEQYYDTKDVYDKLLIMDSTNIDILIKAGIAYSALKEWQNAKNIFQKLISVDNSVSTYYEQLGRCDEALHEYYDAIVHFQIANKLNPKNINTIIKLCSIYFKIEKPISAQRIADASLKIYPTMNELWRIKAEAHFKLEDFKPALESYKNALAYGDTSANVYRNLGISFYSLNKIDSSIAYLDTALTKNDKDIVTALYLGVAYKDINQLDSAIVYLNLVEDLSHNQYLTESYIQLGSLYQLKGEYEKSIAFFNKALDIEPGRNSVLFRLASVYDDYYADKTIALKYFQEFVKDSLHADKTMYKYATERITALKEKIHFSK